MIYVGVFILAGLMVGMVAVASNPSPYYAAFGLVLSAVFGCCILVDLGISFLSLVLLLIYLGGMLVVFAYSASLSAETYPEAWGVQSVLIYIIMYMFGIITYYLTVCIGFGFESMFSSVDVGFSIIISDCSGVGFMYGAGYLLLFVSGWVLLLTLFVVLEVTRGVARGSLRAV
uniref:NADH-ubiquinone oxidoreductase chain 6 n=1 Tax=Oedipina poelzi TaxID=107992 RepID=Q645D8_9SALA|nr:NADH dehydrogenase subunit 6 [Oedipina poelzi]AAU20446.1 NADH dehydrogenase subunit 6 [Oedipina poelzi]